MKRKILSKTILAVIVLLIFSITLPTYAATTNYARAFGSYISNNKSRFDPKADMDTREAVEHAQKTYSSMGYTSTYVLDPSVTTMRSNFASKPTILLIDGHAGPNGMTFKSSTLGISNINYLNTPSYLSYNYLPDGSFDNMKLLILMGCSTADPNSTKNIWRESCVRVNTGCTVMGWKDEIFVSHSTPWCKNFNIALSKGKTVSEAMSYADSKIYGNQCMKNRMVLGGLNQTLTLTSVNELSSSLKTNLKDETLIDENNFYYPSETIKYDENNVQKISELISKIYNEKDIENNYKITISNSTYIDDSENTKEIYIIDYILQVDEFDTTKGYSVHIEDGEIKFIANNMNIINKNEEQKLISSNDIANLSNDFKMPSNIEEIINKSKATSARKYLVTIPDSYNEKQEVQLYYDIDNNKHYVIIHTTNNLEHDVKSVVSDYYEI